MRCQRGPYGFERLLYAPIDEFDLIGEFDLVVVLEIPCFPAEKASGRAVGNRSLDESFYQGAQCLSRIGISFVEGVGGVDKAMPQSQHRVTKQVVFACGVPIERRRRDAHARCDFLHADCVITGFTEGVG
ncbi:Uncharacterised protein [Mycobacteroides abscessus subsp. massiliense]|nr:Uncharacterised protein [Mycobacteroides abscessus subsp. massiliense]